MGLNHEDLLVDNDAKFVIDQEQKTITTTSKKNTLVQFDHWSERAGFEMDRYMDGHDMSLTDRVTIMYSNGGNTGSYIVDDLAVSEDETKIEFTWLIGNPATQNIGTLAFGINFRCFNSLGNVTYNWSTKPCSVYSIVEGVNVTADTIVPDFTDALAKVEAELDALSDELSATVATEVKSYLEKNPPSASITIDSSLSTTSENPVQNKVVASALSGKQDAGDYALTTYVDNKYATLESALSDYITATAAIVGGDA